ncbi:hypothetical protein DAMA08_011340 [Martiniozyma asiatica (nom. inval.)]|nr:hypothetical protein DAMA08_011340 [Martiniozyma asiatica]
MAISIGISYIPQHYKIISRGTSSGLSPTFLLCGSISAFAALINVWLMTMPARGCAANFSLLQILNSLMGLIQVGIQTVGSVLVLALCVYFTGGELEDKGDYKRLNQNWHLFIGFSAFSLFFMAFLYILDRGYNQFGVFCSLLSTLISSFQYLPQIWTTWHLKHAGSLSIPMMCMQTPGGFMWAVSLWMAPGSTWSTWLPYLTGACLQGILLFICISFKWTRVSGLDQINEDIRIITSNREVTEETPLV